MLLLRSVPQRRKGIAPATIFAFNPVSEKFCCARNDLLLRALDIPPIWLIASLAAAFGLDRLVPGLASGLGWITTLGNMMVVAGLGSMGLAVVEFLRAKTSVVPRRLPKSILTHGIYRLSRNPIYLGDALVLGGAILSWDVLPALVLVPAFMGLIQRRFIRGEEAGLLAVFQDEARDYLSRVRRWI
ncbi:MAG: methyltransferase family protein [Maritimibacter sp.]